MYQLIEQERQSLIQDTSEEDRERTFGVDNKASEVQGLTKNRRWHFFLRDHSQYLLILILVVSVVINLAFMVHFVSGLAQCSAGCDCSSSLSPMWTHNWEQPRQVSSNLCPRSQDNYSSPDGNALEYNIFEDLSAAEMESVYLYVSRQFKLKDTGASVLGLELHAPNKSNALDHLDAGGPRPPREARVVLTRPEVERVEEYVVGPLPMPSYHYGNPRRKESWTSIRFDGRNEEGKALQALLQAVTPDLEQLIQESYGATFIQCKSSQCLRLMPQLTSSAYSNTSMVIISTYYATDFVTINPLDLTFLIKETTEGNGEFLVFKVFYAGHVFESIGKLVTAYRLNEIPKTRMRFPQLSPQETSMPGTMNLRGRAFPEFPQDGPREFEPEGRRYNLNGQHVRYMEWSFNFRMSTASGPQIWDVRWAGERIAYEISLQDLGVIYAGANPSAYYSHLSDSAFGLGDKAHGLIPGGDCPDHATFIPQTTFQKTGPKMKPNAFCLFEHNTGLPLRRHKSQDKDNGRNYGGLMDRVLILRTVLVEYNYDYVFDFVFHLNGALQLKSYATGYVMSQVFRPEEEAFGFRIHENIVGSVHHHIFNFKLDLDIRGQSNRYKTLDLGVDSRTWPWSTSEEDRFAQISFQHSLKKSEREAILHYNFSQPKYYIVYNEMAKNKFNNHQAYRVDVKGFSKQLLPDESPVLKSRRWSQYQMLVTRRRDEEEMSSSIFSMYDGHKPFVDIERYLDDDESILDQDLVLWVTVGNHHIPHTEDIPNTPTVGTEASISLLPYNYFPECPSVGSRDAIRADASGSTIILQDYGVRKTSSCIPPNFNYRNFVSKKYNVFD